MSKCSHGSTGTRVDFACVGLGAVVSQVQAGTIKAVAIATPERSDVIKNVPTTLEGGLPEFQVSAWNAIFAPRNLAPPIQAKLNDALVKALDDEATSKRGLANWPRGSRQEGSHPRGSATICRERGCALVVGAEGGPATAN